MAADDRLGRWEDQGGDALILQDGGVRKPRPSHHHFAKQPAVGHDVRAERPMQGRRKVAPGGPASATESWNHKSAALFFGPFPRRRARLH